MTFDDDPILIQQTLDGDQGAYKKLVLKYQRPLFKFLSVYPLAQSQIEEIAQEAFFRAYKNLDRYDESQAAFSSWLFTIAKNLSFNELNRHSHKYELQVNDLEGVMSQEPDTQPDPHSQLESMDFKQRLSQALSLIPNEFRNALVLSHFQELSLDEIAKIENCSLGTVKSRVFRGKLRLLEILRRWETIP